MGVAGGGQLPLSAAASKYVSQLRGGNKENSRTGIDRATPKIITTEAGFLMLTSSQLLMVLVYVLMILLKLDQGVLDLSLKILITLCHSILTPLVMTSFSFMEMWRREKDYNHANKRLERRLQKTRYSMDHDSCV